ncbi:MAG: MmgE/PrpD family protein [Desulfobacteraceae bacterium]|mgnify:CR=1 FL=1|nr:MAG: MmgE/PrpD family protein [Desulfobacteraceae bacterium]
MAYTEQTVAFIRDLEWGNLPAEVQHQSKRCLLDTLGGLLAGYETPVTQIMAQIASSQFPGDQASIMVSGERASVAGAVLVNGFAANALDIDDGYRRIMGHPGACILPVLLGAAQAVKGSGQAVTGTDFLTAMVVGYETGTRAGLIRHATYDTYHSSGSWGAICGAAAAGKLLGLSHDILWHALGTAEYHAPIAPMMKCIDVPAMGKDSIGWGCVTAMLSVLMAREGFTGIRSIFDDAPDPAIMDSLGREWEIMNLYFKPYAACRWAQPAVDGALQLIRENGIALDEIDTIRVFTFEESAALSRQYPENTEEAQYNIPFPIAAGILDKEVGPAQILPPRLFDTDIRNMMDKIEIIAQERFQRLFPEKAESEVEIVTRSGNRFNSGMMSARWDIHTTLPTDSELEEKFLWLAGPLLGDKKAVELKDYIWQIDRFKDLVQLYELCQRSVE